MHFSQKQSHYFSNAPRTSIYSIHTISKNDVSIELLSTRFFIICDLILYRIVVLPRLYNTVFSFNTIHIRRSL